MLDPNEPNTIFDHGWIVRIQIPQIKPDETNTPQRSLLLLHGWTGDETVMWIFTRNIPGKPWIFAPRAPIQVPEGGYGWLPRENGWPSLADFEEIAGKLLSAFHRWAKDAHAPREPLDIMGFSQGAAMAYALAAHYPQQVNRIIALAGFLPSEEAMPGRYAALRGKKVYIAHGTKDETVPVQKAQEAVQTLEAAGADVTYCESDVGHKLSADCLRGFGSFLK